MDEDRGGKVNGCAESPARERAAAIERLVDAVQSERSAPLTLENVERAFNYQPWDRAQQECGSAVRDVLVLAAKQILRSVPPGKLRARALDCLIDARMLANAGITFRGEF